VIPDGLEEQLLNVDWMFEARTAGNDETDVPFCTPAVVFH
jgi:hypothetical protein